MNAFDAALNALYRDPNLRQTALYRPGGIGPGIDVAIFVWQEADPIAPLSLSVNAPRYRLDVRRCEVVQVRKTDTFTCGPVTYSVLTAELDAEGRTWKTEVRRAG